MYLNPLLVKIDFKKTFTVETQQTKILGYVSKKLHKVINHSVSQKLAHSGHTADNRQQSYIGTCDCLATVPQKKY
jgi:hypothetical protein